MTKMNSKIEGNTLGILRRSFFPSNALGMPSFNNSAAFLQDKFQNKGKSAPFKGDVSGGRTFTSTFRGPFYRSDGTHSFKFITYLLSNPPLSMYVQHVHSFKSSYKKARIMFCYYAICFVVCMYFLPFSYKFCHICGKNSSKRDITTIGKHCILNIFKAFMSMLRAYVISFYFMILLSNIFCYCSV